MAVILIFYLSYFLAKIRRFYPQFPLRNQKIYHTVEAIQKELDQVFKDFQSRGSKASQELERLWEVMTVLLPQIKYFIETGFVANKKIIHLKISELYSIVRGKAGKKTEFGIKWGINRMGGGFVSGFVMESCKHASDIKFCHQAVLEHVKTFWAAPETYGFDRGGYSKGYGDTLGAPAGFERGAFPLKTGGERYKTPGQYRSDLKGQTADGVLVIGRGI
jgi:hypothetical protein